MSRTGLRASGGPDPPPPLLRVLGGDRGLAALWRWRATGVLPGGEARRGEAERRVACVVCVWWWEEALGGGGVPLAVVTGCGACAGRASPPRRLGLRSLGSSRPLPPLHAAATSPRPSSCLSIPGPVIPLSVGGPAAPEPPGRGGGRRRLSPPTHASGPSPSSRLSLSPYPFCRTPLTPNFVASREGLEVCVCLSLAMGVVGGGRGGVCRRCRVAVAVRVGRWGASGWCVCASCPPLPSPASV